MSEVPVETTNELTPNETISPTSSSEDARNIQEVTHYVQTLLQSMQDKFQMMSDQIISRIDEMNNRVEDLEKNIADVMTQAGIEPDK